MATDVVAEAATGLGMEVSVAGSPAEAVAQAMSRSGPDDRVVVCGSLYVVADARRLLVPPGA
jgi:folylpolyglutamate synthase/dihydropteroate synthase